MKIKARSCIACKWIREKLWWRKLFLIGKTRAKNSYGNEHSYYWCARMTSFSCQICIHLEMVIIRDHTLTTNHIFAVKISKCSNLTSNSLSRQEISNPAELRESNYTNSISNYKVSRVRNFKIQLWQVHLCQYFDCTYSNREWTGLSNGKGLFLTRLPTCNPLSTINSRFKYQQQTISLDKKTP